MDDIIDLTLDISVKDEEFEGMSHKMAVPKRTGDINLRPTCLKDSTNIPLSSIVVSNGEEKTCTFVKLVDVEKSQPLNKNDNSKTKVQCPKCKFLVLMEDFKDHIDSCSISTRSEKESFSQKSSVHVGMVTTTQDDDLAAIIQPKDTSLEEVSSSTEVLSDLLLPVNTFPCALCSYAAENKRVLFEHTRYHKKFSPIVMQCMFCPERYTHRWLKQHIETMHSGQKVIWPTLKRISTTRQPRTQLKNKNLPKTVDGDGKSSKASREFKCTKCAFSSNLNIKLNMHIKKYHSQSNTKSAPAAVVKNELKCKLCSFVATKLLYLKQHTLAHQRHPTRQCAFCEFRSTPLVVNKHALIHGRKLKCKFCPYITSDVACLKRHETSHGDNPPVKGVESQKLRVNLGTKINTSFDVAAPETGKTYPFKCSLCAFTTNLRIKLKFHEKRGRHDCEYCSASKLSTSSYKAHLYCHKKGEPIIKCDECPFKSTKSYLRYHKRRTGHGSCPPDVSKSAEESSITSTSSRELRSSEQQFKCPRCPFTSRFRMGLNVHTAKCELEQEPDKEGKIRCTACSFTTTDRQSYKFHYISHRNNVIKIKKCRYCAFKGPKKLVETHMRCCEKSPNFVKFNGRKFSCTLCSYVSLSFQSYKRHIGIHSTKKSNLISKCALCSFKGTLAQLTSHEKVCTPSKQSHDQVAVVEDIASDESTLSLKCKHCSFKSYYRYVIDRHMQLHTLNLPINQCPKCDFRSTPSALKAHVNFCGRGNNVKCAL